MPGHHHRFGPGSPSQASDPVSQPVAAPTAAPSNDQTQATLPVADPSATPTLDAVDRRGGGHHHHGRDPQWADDPAQSTDPTIQTPAPVNAAPVDGAPAAPTAALPATLDAAALQTATDAAIAVAPADLAAYAGTAIPPILSNAARMDVRSANQVAYLLATAEHESRFGKPLYSRSESLVEDHNPYTEGANGSWSARVHTNSASVTGGTEEQLDQNYWDSAYGGRLGNEKGTADAANFRGRGFVQLTGRTNYEDMTRRLNDQGYSYAQDGVTYGGQGNPAIDLVAHPDHVNRNEDLAARILVLGATQGTFTGAALGDYVDDQQTDFYDARSVINGDKATNGQSIADKATTYARALSPLWTAVFQPRQT